MGIPINIRFGTNLRRIRLAKGISQEHLAESADLHRTYVSSVERGERNVTIQTVEKLAKALAVSMSKLMPD
ncbi:MAG TPA: helix-turn-helix transcriptional regulator [Lacipirellulaceae bacterium]|nr:helix-turn-helix transcriptional regulator [Lacipirellulaceae bacterium]